MFLLVAGLVTGIMASMFFKVLDGFGIVFIPLYFICKAKLKYKTDIEGLYVEVRSGLTGYKWKRIFKWTDVSTASWGNSDTGKINFVLKQDWRRSVTLGRTDGRLTQQSTSAIEASIYQHLKRVGVTNVFELRLYADSYWMEIPAWIPDTATIERDEQEFIMTYNVSPELLEVKWRPKDENVSFVGESAEDKVEYTRVCRCKWDKPDTSDLELSVVADNVDTTIRADSDEPEMLKLMLAAIRQLRMSKIDAVWLPNMLVGYLRDGKSNNPQIYAD